MATSVLKLQGLPALSAGPRAVSGAKPRCIKLSQSLRSRSIAAKGNATKRISPVVCEAVGTYVAGKQDGNWIPVIPIEALPKGERRLVRQDGETILLLWYRNEIYAIENSSPAEGAYAEGFINAKLTQVSVNNARLPIFCIMIEVHSLASCWRSRPTHVFKLYIFLVACHTPTSTVAFDAWI